MPDLSSAFRDFYTCYDLLNKLCWGGTLPYCPLEFSKRMRRAWAVAYDGIYRIRFNSAMCSHTTDVHILMIMAHEMTHIWQYCHGARGGHGKDFYAEMERIGIMGRTIMSTREGSCFAYMLFMYSLKNIKLAQAMQLINSSCFDKKFETKMFNQIMEEKLCP